MDEVTLSRLQVLHRDRQDFLNDYNAQQSRILARLRRIAADRCERHTPPKCEQCVRLSHQWAKGKGDPNMVAVAQEINQPLLIAQKPLEIAVKRTSKEMIKIAHDLPIAPFIEETRGFGWLGAAQIIAEAGALDNYSGPAKLWKRFGLAVMSDGHQRRIANDPERAKEHGFNPRRRALIHSIGDALIKQGEHYRMVYLERKAQEPAELSQGHRHNRAQRFMEKRLLTDMWVAWNA